MKKSLKSALAAATAAAALAAAPAGAQVINLDAQTTTTAAPYTQLLGAGTYQVFDVGPADAAGALYDAWNPWGAGAGGCNISGSGCSWGWYRRWYMNFGGGEVGNNSGFFSSAALALAGAKTDDPFSFTLLAPTTVSFWIADSPYYDNAGGVSLSIAAVPEPETWALMMAGLGLLGFAARRRAA
ncbi:MAG: hypothetical protein EFKGCFLK_02691 [Rhodocyclaceae bacterium]|nr:hypothetical protein [Rhodocyclaceae bacterium]